MAPESLLIAPCDISTCAYFITPQLLIGNLESAHVLLQHAARWEVLIALAMANKNKGKQLRAYLQSDNYEL